MKAATTRLEPAFLQQQTEKLTLIKQQLLDRKSTQDAEQASTQSATLGQAHEYEDDAQKLTELELQGNLAAAANERLSTVERALQKIQDQTYGLSDLSGAPISRDRLEAFPEALYTVDEQSTRDAS